MRKLDLGKYCPDGLWITSDKADLSNEPDATFLSWRRFESGEVRLIPGRRGRGGIEMRGSPDWVLEIVSDASVRKDTVLLSIYRRGRKAFEPTPAVRGWISSEVFLRRFRLIRERDRIGGWTYTLKVSKAPSRRKGNS